MFQYRQSDPLKRKEPDILFVNDLFNAIIKSGGTVEGSGETVVVKNVYRLRSQNPSKIPPVKVVCESKGQVKSFYLIHAGLKISRMST